MLWIIIGTLFLIFLYSSFDIVDGDKIVFVYIGLMSVFIIAIVTTSSYFNKHQTVKESTEVYEVCRCSDNEYFQENTAGNSITIRVKTNNGVKEKTFNRKIVTFVDSNSSTATVNYKEKEKFTSGQKFWFILEDGKDAGKKKATKVILSIPLDSEQKVEDNTEQSDTVAKGQKNQGLLNVKNVDHKTTLMQNIASTAERKLQQNENAPDADKFLKETQSTVRNVE